MSQKSTAVLIAALALTGGIYTWAGGVHSQGELNAQAIKSLEIREDRHADMHDDHRSDHLVFKSEYREDQQRIEEKLDRILDKVLEHIETVKE
jgi:hypothetical protein